MQLAKDVSFTNCFHRRGAVGSERRLAAEEGSFAIRRPGAEELGRVREGAEAASGELLMGPVATLSPSLLASIGVVVAGFAAPFVVVVVFQPLVLRFLVWGQATRYLSGVRNTARVRHRRRSHSSRVERRLGAEEGSQSPRRRRGWTKRRPLWIWWRGSQRTSSG